MPKAYPTPREQERHKACAPVPASRESQEERDATRKEAIASAIREWIIPTLVRRFLAERTRAEEQWAAGSKVL